MAVTIGAAPAGTDAQGVGLHTQARGGTDPAAASEALSEQVFFPPHLIIYSSVCDLPGARGARGEEGGLVRILHSVCQKAHTHSMHAHAPCESVNTHVQLQTLSHV